MTEDKEALQKIAELREKGKEILGEVGYSLRATVSYNATLDALQIAIDKAVRAIAKVEGAGYDRRQRDTEGDN